MGSTDQHRPARGGKLNTTDLVEEAWRLLIAPIDLGDWTPDNCETLEQVEAAEQEERRRRWAEVLEAYIAQRSDRLEVLRYVRRAALDRIAQYEDEAKRWTRRRDNQRGLVEYVERMAHNVLVAERELAGASGPYRVELPNGAKVGIRVTSAVEANVSELANEWVRTKLVTEPDKVKIKKALEAGEEVRGARLVEREHVDWGR